MSIPLVTIVIPTYNDDPEHLRESVGSALEQTAAQVEVVLVDDGSTRPETVAALDTFATFDRVRLLRQANAGAAAAMNAGMRLAAGTYCMVLGADDRINDIFVEACLAAMGPRVAFAYYESLDFFWDGGRVEPQPSTPVDLELSGFMGQNRIAAVALFRRVDWEKVGGFVEEPGSVFEDYHFWVELLSCDDDLRAVQAPGARLEYRQREGSRRSHKPAAERLSLTRSSLMSTDDLVVLRRMLAASMRRISELESDLAAAARQRARSPWPVRAIRAVLTTTPHLRPYGNAPHSK